MDLRSGAQKSSVVPPKRHYRKREMVVHTPSKLDTLRQAAAERRAASAADVPPSVAAAAAAAPGAVAPAPPSVDGDLLGGLTDDHAGAEAQTQHDFEAWDGDIPPALRTNATVHQPYPRASQR